MPNSIPLSWGYILTACIRVSNSFSFFANSLMLSMYIRWLIFSCDLWSSYPRVHFLRISLSSIIPITNSNSNGDSLFPWNIPLWIFALAKLFPPAIIFPVFHCFHGELYDIVEYSCTFWDSQLSSFVGSYLMPFCCQSTRWQHFSSPLALLENVLIIKVDLLFLLLPCGILSVLLGPVHGLFTIWKYPP